MNPNVSPLPGAPSANSAASWFTSAPKRRARSAGIRARTTIVVRQAELARDTDVPLLDHTADLVRFGQADEPGTLEDADVMTDAPLRGPQPACKLLDAGRPVEHSAKDPPAGRVTDGVQLLGAAERQLR